MALDRGKMIIISGGAGFIGSAIIWQLNQMGVSEIIVCDHFRKGNKWLNLRGLQYQDFIHPSELENYVSEKNIHCHSIIHMGACSSTSEEDMDYLFINNYSYSKKLYELSHRLGCKFIYASSAATYGNGEIGFSDEKNLDNLRPINKYGYSKQLFDLYIDLEKKRGNIPRNNYIGLKFFNVFGPNEFHKGSMASVLYHGFQGYKATGKIKLFKSENPKYKDGEQLRDFIYIKDITRIIYQILDEDITSGIYNIGTGKARTFIDFVENITGDLKDIEFIDMPDKYRKQYQYYTQADNNKIREALSLGDDFFTPIEDATKDYIENYLRTEKYLEYYTETESL